MHRFLVEFLGTAWLAYIVLATGNYLAIGAALAAAVLLGGAISGGAFNPAVTLALVAAGRLPRADALPYLVAQVAGALLGCEAWRLSRD
jgi:aquaporin Z